MKTMAADSFTVHCLAVLDEVQSTRQTIVITKRGRPVVKLVPADQPKDEIYNFLQGKGNIMGDVTSPAIEGWGNLK